MQTQKWLSITVILFLFTSLFLFAIAEEEIIAPPVDAIVEETFFDLEEPYHEQDVCNAESEIQEKNGQAIEAPTGSDFEIDDGVLIKYTGTENNITIPRGITEIGYGAFESDKNLESVVIPDSVTTIQSSAFFACENLKSISIPDSVTTIGGLAFSCCSKLKTISLPKRLISIEEGLFSSCDSLTEITIPSSVDCIGSYAFSYCNNLKSVAIQNGAERIEDSFIHCKSLERIDIPVSVTKIDRTAFNQCDNVVICGMAGSFAEQYANSCNIPFNAPIISFAIKDEDLYYDGFVVHISRSKTINAIQKPAALTTTLVWKSSDERIATVDQSGIVTAVSDGTATITATTANGKGKAAKISIIVPEPTSIRLSSFEMEHLLVGETLWINAYTYTDYSNVLSDSFPVSWTISDPSIATIESEGRTSDNNFMAYIKGISTGVTTLTATTPDKGSASVTITVSLPAPTAVKINQVAPDGFLPGNTFQLTASMEPADAVSALSWYSSDTTVARVDQNGLVTAIKPGSTTITVNTDNGKSAFLSLTVISASTPASTDETTIIPAPTEPDNSQPATELVPVIPNKLTLTPKKATLGAKEKLALSVALTPADAQAALSWKSSNKKVATVSDSGVVTGKKAGKAKITVTAQNGVSATFTVTVKAAPKQVTLNKTGNVTLKKGKTLKLKATLDKNAASALTWTSSNKKVAKVDKNGKVTALKKGTATITVKTFNKKKATVKITVK